MSKCEGCWSRFELVVNLTIFIPNRTLLVRFGGISGEFGRAMVQNTHGETKSAWYAADFTKKDRLGIYRVQIQSGELDIVAMSGQGLDIAGYQDSWQGVWLANCEFGYGNVKNLWLQYGVSRVFIVGRWYAIYIWNSPKNIHISISISRRR